tara:strand:+ start:711 stop:812 length:102 start_codon:yes stop_codon:yes gene_type:complete
LDGEKNTKRGWKETQRVGERREEGERETRNRWG